MKKIQVVAGLIIQKDLVFCTKRKDKGPLALKWEFPGGKIEQGETHEEALIRELKEELDVIVEVQNVYMTINHEYPTFNLTMYVYQCTGDLSRYNLNEHSDAKWVAINDLSSLDWAEADLPVINKLRNILI